MLPAATFETRSRLSTSFLGKPTEDDERILKTYGPFIYEDKHIINLFWKNVLKKKATPWPRL